MVEHDRVCTGIGKVAAPPNAIEACSRSAAVTSIGFFDALDEDQPSWIDRVDRISGTRRSLLPVACWVITAPARLVVRFVVDVGTDDGRVAGIATGEELPVADQPRFGELIVVPEVVAIIEAECVTVENHPESLLASGVDHGVHEFKAGQSCVFGIRRDIEAIGSYSLVEQLRGERQPNCVEAKISDLGDHRIEVSGPQAVRHGAGAIETEPVDTTDSNLVARAIHDVGTAGAPKTAPHRAIRLRDTNTGYSEDRCYQSHCEQER